VSSLAQPSLVGHLSLSCVLNTLYILESANQSAQDKSPYKLVPPIRCETADLIQQASDAIKNLGIEDGDVSRNESRTDTADLLKADIIPESATEIPGMYLFHTLMYM